MKTVKEFFNRVPAGWTSLAVLVSAAIVASEKGLGMHLGLWMAVLLAIPGLLMGLLEDQDWAAIAFFLILILGPALILLGYV